MIKVCIKCKIEKDESCFSFRKDNSKHRNECKECKDLYYKNYYLENKEQVLKNKKKYNQENKNKISKNNKNYYEENKEQILKHNKEHRNENKEKLNKQNNKYIKKRRKSDSVYKLKCNTSRMANIGLKNRNSSKNGNSFFKFMEFTGKELMYHLMNHPQREWWMHENNQGSYRLDKWDDNDPSTWVWNLDHIIPHSEFNYTSMDDPEFKKCWSLENLRPYSAKQNILDGNRR